MEDKDRNHFNKLILDHIEKIKKEIVILKDKSKPIPPDNAIGRLTRMEAINERSICEANLRTSELRLFKLSIALKSVNTNDYGECLKCGDDISLARLNVLPESTICIECLNNTDD